MAPTGQPRAVAAAYLWCGSDGWRIELLLAQLFGYRRLVTRYECRADLYCGFLTLAAALTGYKHLAT